MKIALGENIKLIRRSKRINESLSRKVFICFNYIFLSLVAITCIFPIINVFAVSFSSKFAADSGAVSFWPVDFTTAAYEFVLSSSAFITALGVSVKRVILGVIINMLIIVITAYPLSKEKKVFRARTYFAWFFVITMLFNPGLIPWYMTINAYGLIDKIWALVLPGAVNVFNVIIMMNFYRQLPSVLEEAAFIDGASHWKILWKIYLPLSLPALATLTLFSLVSHWNSWFDGILLMDSPKNYPLQSLLQTIVVNSDQSTNPLNPLVEYEVSERTNKAAQVFLAALPVLCVYPFLQRFFMKGLVMGSVKE